MSLLGASGLAGLAWAGLAYGVSFALPDATGTRLHGQLWILFGMGVAYFALSLVFHYLVLALEETRSVEMREKEARVLTREAELRALRFQINPHFLFNSLNSIAALTTSSPDQARRMTQLLSSFLRASLRLGDRQNIPLREELQHVRDYLDIERVRFTDRLRVVEQIDEGSLNALVPPLLLQPLVENAVKHGIAGLEDGGTVTLSVTGKADRLALAVENPVDAQQASGTDGGHGLSNVRERLQAYYGKEARMVVDRKPGLFRVELNLPVSGGSS
jgi:LytS/YehU family sensor histidine kinase